ncbi:MAG: hypothetical protein ACTSPP_10500 [Candidatus Heimdallarchaeaceae archaeon]
MVKAKYSVRAELTKEEYERLIAIKEHYGLQANTEALRLSINDAYKIMKQREKILAAVSKDIEDTDK